MPNRIDSMHACQCAVMLLLVQPLTLSSGLAHSTAVNLLLAGWGLGKPGYGVLPRFHAHTIICYCDSDQKLKLGGGLGTRPYLLIMRKIQ